MSWKTPATDITQDSRVDGRNIEVTVQNGEVTLDGTVESRMAKRRAEDCAENVSGRWACAEQSAGQR